MARVVLQFGSGYAIAYEHFRRDHNNGYNLAYVATPLYFSYVIFYAATTANAAWRTRTR